MIDLKNCNAQEIMNQFSCLTNNLLFKPNKTAEEYQDSALMEDLDLCWIKTVSGSGYRTDLRNEASSRVGRQLINIPFVAKRLEHSNNPKMAEVAEKMSREHRTLQQTFSKLIFYHFMLTCNRKEQQILCDAMGEEFYRLPLI